MIPPGELLLQAAKTKSRELTDHGSQLLTNALHDYHEERMMENLHWLLLVVVIGKGWGGEWLRKDVKKLCLPQFVGGFLY